MLVWLSNTNIAEGVAEVVVLTYAPGGVLQNFSGYTATWRIIQEGKVWASGPATLGVGLINVSLSALQTAIPKPTAPQKLNAAGVLEIVATNGSNTFIFNSTVILARREDSDDGVGILSSLSPEPPPSSPPLLQELNLSDLDDVPTARTNLGLGSMALLTAGTGGAQFRTNTQNDAQFQPLDSDLTAIATLTTTSFGRGFLALADAAATRTAITAPATPSVGSAIPGQVTGLYANTGASLSLPAGGTWWWFTIERGTAGNTLITTNTSVSAGGTSLYGAVPAGRDVFGWCWRVA